MSHIFYKQGLFNSYSKNQQKRVSKIVYKKINRITVQFILMPFCEKGAAADKVQPCFA